MPVLKRRNSAKPENVVGNPPENYAETIRRVSNEFYFIVAFNGKIFSRA